MTPQEVSLQEVLARIGEYEIINRRMEAQIAALTKHNDELLKQVEAIKMPVPTQE